MHVVRGIVVAVVLAFASVPPAFAQEPTQQQYEAIMSWAARHQRVQDMVVGPLQQIPEPFIGGTARERAAWVSRARGWISSYRTSLQGARDGAARLGPVPEAGSISTLYRNQERALVELLGTIDTFVAEYERGVVAIERNDEGALQLSLIASVDAALLIQTQFRNFNSMQAEAVSDGPQRYLLRSFASSYDGFIAVMQARRASYLGDNVNRTSAASVAAAAGAIREHSRQGRAAAIAQEAFLPASVPPEQSDFISRVRTAYRSFQSSFAREERIADLFDSVAALLASGRTDANLDAEIDQILVEISRLDYERMGDIQRRTQLVQMITPPT